MLLAIDSSTQWMGLALYDGAEVVSQMMWRSQNNHTVELTAAIQNLLARNDVLMNDITALGVALGPGSYTCLRVGLAVVKGIALGKRVPVYGIPTMDVLVYSIPLDSRPVMAILVAGRGRYSYSLYKAVKNHWVNQREYLVATPLELAELLKERTIVCGEIDSATRSILEEKCPYIDILSPARCSRNPAYLAEIAWKRHKKDDKDDIVNLAPIYSRVDKAIPG